MKQEGIGGPAGSMKRWTRSWDTDLLPSLKSSWMNPPLTSQKANTKIPRVRSRVKWNQRLFLTARKHRNPRMSVLDVQCQNVVVAEVASQTRETSSSSRKRHKKTEMLKKTMDEVMSIKSLKYRESDARFYEMKMKRMEMDERRWREDRGREEGQHREESSSLMCFRF